MTDTREPADDALDRLEELVTHRTTARAQDYAGALATVRDELQRLREHGPCFSLDEMQQVREQGRAAEARVAELENGLRPYMAEHEKTIGAECWCPSCKQARALLADSEVKT